MTSRLLHCWGLCPHALCFAWLFKELLGAPGRLQVYVAYTEGRNFQRSLGDLLGLPSGATIGACLQRIRQLLDRCGCPAAATPAAAGVVGMSFFLQQRAPVMPEPALCGRPRSSTAQPYALHDAPASLANSICQHAGTDRSLTCKTNISEVQSRTRRMQTVLEGAGRGRGPMWRSGSAGGREVRSQLAHVCVPQNRSCAHCADSGCLLA